MRIPPCKYYYLSLIDSQQFIFARHSSISGWRLSVVHLACGMVHLYGMCTACENISVCIVDILCLGVTRSVTRLYYCYIMSIEVGQEVV